MNLSGPMSILNIVNRYSHCQISVLKRIWAPGLNNNTLAKKAFKTTLISVLKQFTTTSKQMGLSKCTIRIKTRILVSDLVSLLMRVVPWMDLDGV